MKPEEFAKQFFDLWQQSAGQMMRDPAFSHKMFELMQQSGQFWNQAASSANNPAYGASNPTSAMRPAPDDGADAKPADELAHRLELCEQRLAVIESLFREWSSTASKLSAGLASGSYPQD